MPTRLSGRFVGALALGVAGLIGCAGPSPEATKAGGDPFDVPLEGISHEAFLAFNEGDTLFDLQLRDADGLGPLYTRNSCGACHNEGVRGPGLVQKMSVVEADGVTASLDQSLLPYGNTVHPLITAGATTPIVPPAGVPSVKVTIRMGPPVLGRGYMEAVEDEEILRVSAEQATRADGIHGRVNHVVFASEANSDTTFHQHQKGDVVIGRFGLKARVATLDDFTADAFQGDMGITSPMRPTEFANPDHLTDDEKPGVDVTQESINKRANYVRMIAIPRRGVLSRMGRALFEQARCSVCHVPTLKTRADYPLALLAGIEAPIFTDLLLHDMGDGLADGTRQIDGEATSRDWRTAPLLGLRFNRTFLHDGRASSVEDAIRAHEGPGSEANDSVRRFETLSEVERKALIDFVQAL